MHAGRTPNAQSDLHFPSIRIRVLGVILLGVLAGSAPAVAGGLDPICSKYVEDRGYQKFFNTRSGARASGDTIYWETKVLPDFERIAKDPKFQSEALLNAKFKGMLASYGLRENEITGPNQDRIISDCHSNPQLEGCIAMQTYCVRDYVNTQYPKALDNFQSCFEAKNRKGGCGKDFQTADGIQRNLAVLSKFQKRFDDLTTEIAKLPAVPEYLSDIQGTFESYSAKVQAMLAQGKKKFEDLKKQEAAAADQRYQNASKRADALGDACRAFNECKSYLKRQGHEDRKELLNQISSCQVKDETNAASGAQFDAAMKVLDGVQTAAQKKSLEELAVAAFDTTLSSTARQYLETYLRINGALPSEDRFCGALGGRAKCADPVLKAAYSEAKSRAGSIPKLDLAKEIEAFNTKVKALNAACADATKSGASDEKNTAAAGKIETVMNAENAILYGSTLGGLTVIGKFSDRVGKLDQKACLAGGEGMKPLDPKADIGRVQDSLNEMADIISEKGRELIRNKKDLTDPDDPGAGIRYFLENEPLALRELIRQTNNPEQARLLCQGIEKIYAKEARRKFWSKTLMWASVVGAAVATVLTMGAATPLLAVTITAVEITSFGVGAYNTATNITHAMQERSQTNRSVVTGTFDRDVGKSIMDEDKSAIKGEIVGFGLQFVPVAGKMLGNTVNKTVIQPALRSTFAAAMAETKLWRAVSTTTQAVSKPVATLITKVKAGSATFGDLSAALLSKATTPGVSKAMVSAFNTVTAGMAPDIAMIVSASVLTNPHPFSNEGMLEMLEAIVQSRGIAALGPAGGKLYAKLKGKGTKTVPLIEIPVKETNNTGKRKVAEKIEGTSVQKKMTPAEIEADRNARIKKLVLDDKPVVLRSKDAPFGAGNARKVPGQNEISDLLSLNPSVTDATRASEFAKLGIPVERPKDAKYITVRMEEAAASTNPLMKEIVKLQNEIVAAGGKGDVEFRIRLDDEGATDLGSYSAGSNVVEIGKATFEKYLKTGIVPDTISHELRHYRALRSPKKDSKFDADFRPVDESGSTGVSEYGKYFSGHETYAQRKSTFGSVRDNFNAIESNLLKSGGKSLKEKINSSDRTFIQTELKKTTGGMHHLKRVAEMGEVYDGALAKLKEMSPTDFAAEEGVANIEFKVGADLHHVKAKLNCESCGRITEKTSLDKAEVFLKEYESSHDLGGFGELELQSEGRHLLSTGDRQISDKMIAAKPELKSYFDKIDSLRNQILSKSKEELIKQVSDLKSFTEGAGAAKTNAEKLTLELESMLNGSARATKKEVLDKVRELKKEYAKFSGDANRGYLGALNAQAKWNENELKTKFQERNRVATLEFEKKRDGVFSSATAEFEKIDPNSLQFFNRMDPARGRFQHTFQMDGKEVEFQVECDACRGLDRDKLRQKTMPIVNGTKSAYLEPDQLRRESLKYVQFGTRDAEWLAREPSAKLFYDKLDEIRVPIFKAAQSEVRQQIEALLTGKIAVTPKGATIGGREVLIENADDGTITIFVESPAIGKPSLPKTSSSNGPALSSAGIDPKIRVSTEDVRRNFPEKSNSPREVGEWRANSETKIKGELRKQNVKNPDQVAKSIVRNIEKTARLDRKTAQAIPPAGLLSGRLRSGTAGAVGKKVVLSKDAATSLKKAQPSIARKLADWITGVEKNGLNEMRKQPGYHDEPIGGDLGLRSIRLNDGVRATYRIGVDGKIKIIGVGNDLYDH